MIQAQVSSSRPVSTKAEKFSIFAVAVLMIGVGGLVGDADREKSQQRGDQVEAGVRGFRKNTQAAGAESHHDFQPGNDDGGQNGISRSRALLGAHQIGRRKWPGFPTCRNYRRCEWKAPSKSRGSCLNEKKLNSRRHDIARKELLSLSSRGLNIDVTSGKPNKWPIMLGFTAWHFQLSDGPILEEMIYA